MGPSSRRTFLRAALGAGTLAAVGRGTGREASSLHERLGTAFGTTVSLKVLAPPAVAQAALSAAFAEIRAVERALSLFDPRSDLRRLNAAGTLRGADFRAVEAARLARALAVRTAGAFDVTVQPYWDLWRAATAATRMPADGELQRARDLVDFRGLYIGAEELRLAGRGRAATFNGIAQGYATDRVMAILQQYGVRSAFTDTGEIGAFGDRGGSAWTCAIVHPRDRARLLGWIRPVDGFVATSADYATAFSADFSNHHIFDPTTGRSPHELACATVVARSGARADALATAAMVLGIRSSLALAQTMSGVAMVLVTKEGAVHTSPGAPFVPARHP